jgi:hypothetical protein
MAIDLKRAKSLDRRPEPEQPVESIRITESENGGFMLYVQRKPKPAPKSGRNAICGPMWEPEKPYVFASWADASAFVNKAFGGK